MRSKSILATLVAMLLATGCMEEMHSTVLKTAEDYPAIKVKPEAEGLRDFQKVLDTVLEPKSYKMFRLMTLVSCRRYYFPSGKLRDARLVTKKTYYHSAMINIMKGKYVAVACDKSGVSPECYKDAKFKAGVFKLTKEKLDNNQTQYTLTSYDPEDDEDSRTEFRMIRNRDDDEDEFNNRLLFAVSRAVLQRILNRLDDSIVYK